MKYDFLKDEVVINKLLVEQEKSKVFKVVIRKSEKMKDSFIFEFYNEANNIYSFESKTEKEINKIFLNQIRKQKLIKINQLCLVEKRPKRRVKAKA